MNAAVAGKRDRDPLLSLPLLMLIAAAGCAPDAARSPRGALSRALALGEAQPGESQSWGDSAQTQTLTPSWVSPIGARSRNRMNDIQAYMATIGLTSIHQQGTIDLRNATLSSGIHVLRSTCGQPVANMTATCTSITGTLATGAAALAGQVVAGQSNLNVQSAATTTGRQAGARTSLARQTTASGTTGSQATGSQSTNGQTATGQTFTAQPAGSQVVTGAATAAGVAAVAEEVSVTRYTGDEVSDVSVILADKVIFDNATVTLSDGVTELWILAETIESENSIINWEHVYSTADAFGDPACAPSGSDNDPHNETTVSSFNSPSGGNGTPGAPGHAGNAGIHAPDVYVYLKYFTDDGDFHVSLPSIKVEGQHGGVGQRGQCGGVGGDGAKGSDAHQNVVNCTQGPGFGGDGGDGGDGGPGGPGGPGGDGGDVYIHFVQLPNVAVQTTIHDTDGGRAGVGGLGGLAGDGGEGGEAGDPKWPYCVATPERAGDDGDNGIAGGHGTAGTAGTKGDLQWIMITEAEWEEAFTAPYIESASPTVANVGESFTISTLNVTGDAVLNVQDEYGTFSASFPLVAQGADSYRWVDTAGMSAGIYVVTITRMHDGRVTNNSYRLQLKPVIDGVQFASPFDAVFGGPAKIVGLGMRADASIVLDGTDIGPGWLCTTGCPSGRHELSFVIPIAANAGTFFVRDDGVTPHDVHLDQPYPLEDSARVEFLLKRQAGLTFRPTVNGYPFNNATLTAAAKIDAGKNPWQSFRETYGGLEVDAYLALMPFTDLVMESYAAWKLFWMPRIPSALCTGISSSVLDDYFRGVTGVNGYQTSDVAHTVMVRQGHLLSREVLTSLTLETVVGASFETSATVGKVVSFMETGTDADGGDAPVLIMIPSPSVYLPAVITALTGLLPAAVGVALGTIVPALGSSHSLAPFNVVYTNPTDALPSRIYFYDSNAPNVDTAFMTIGGAGTTFTYNMFNTATTPYLYSTASNWTLGHGTVDFLHGEASLPLVPLP